MRQFRVYLTGQASDDPRWTRGLAEIALSSQERNAIVRQYRTYLPDARWLPQAPVFVWLTGPNGKSLPRQLTPSQDYELSLLSTPKEQPRLKKILAAAAAAAAVIMPMSSASADPIADRTSTPPSVHDRGTSVVSDVGPPTASLNSATRRNAHGLQPLLDSRGRPVELGAFHSNAVTHTNAITAHTNNALVPHSNVWQNHSNVPGYSIPHTNVVPGDFIF